MATEVKVPDIGDFTDVPIVEVHVSAGDQVSPEDPLVTLESDKASMDVPAPEGGEIEEVKVAVGDTVSEGDVILVLSSDGGGAGDGGESKADEAAEQAEESSPEEPPAGGEGGEAGRQEEQPLPDEETLPEEEAGASAGPSDGAAVYASPSARRLAREAGVDLSAIRGSGRKGRITKADVEAAKAGGGPAAAPAAEGVPGGEERVPLTRIQQLARDNLSEAWRTIPHVTHNDEADVTDLEAFRKQLNAEQDEVKVTMVALLLRASAATLRAFPRFASSLDGDELIVKHDLHLGFAADTPQGLVVPVIRDVDRKGLFQIAAELTDLSGKARAGKLGPKEMSGAVFTISSLGGIGGTSFTPIVNPPQVAILGAVRTQMRPVWNGERFEPRLMLPLSLSYDHRVIDGAAAARFCRHLATVLEDMRRVLL